MLLWTWPSYREATAGTESAPLWGVHRGGRVGEPHFWILPVVAWESRGCKVFTRLQVPGGNGNGGEGEPGVQFPRTGCGQWIASVFLWVSVLLSIAWSLWCPSTTLEEGQEDLNICIWVVALSSPPGSVAEGSTGGKHGKKLDLKS